MFKTLQNAFRIKDIRRKIFYVLFMLVVIRVGSQLPVPGVNRDYLTGLLLSQEMHLTFLMHLPEGLFIHVCVST